MVAIRLPNLIARKLQDEAKKLGLSVEEYLLEILSQGLDPKNRAQEYIEVALELVEKAREELARGDIRQASEKIWSAAALAVKAYAYWKGGRRLSSHGELWEYTQVLRRDLGRWVYGSWAYANAMHTCFCEGWCVKEHVESAIEDVEKLVKAIKSKIRS